MLVWFIFFDSPSSVMIQLFSCLCELLCIKGYHRQIISRWQVKPKCCRAYPILPDLADCDVLYFCKGTLYIESFSWKREENRLAHHEQGRSHRSGFHRINIARMYHLKCQISKFSWGACPHTPLDNPTPHTGVMVGGGVLVETDINGKTGENFTNNEASFANSTSTPPPPPPPTS